MSNRQGLGIGLEELDIFTNDSSGFDLSGFDSDLGDELEGIEGGLGFDLGLSF